ncbi:hypothetical protein SAMN05216353_11259 [Halobacillus alkaliphilus]|uniref:Uncharacterized protein n=1 Tax=Halobacillus alkaliphilus TaxID=396056 RepID=A0A1I2MC03_9BACI|nr:hypothetical protein [Halobacillus alkaliphilus]SFF88993.1 hypothetical protein SAMN05216353_11259 [Halobacillus alkaliphilus]
MAILLGVLITLALSSLFMVVTSNIKLHWILSTQKFPDETATKNPYEINGKYSS